MKWNNGSLVEDRIFIDENFGPPYYLCSISQYMHHEVFRLVFLIRFAAVVVMWF